MDGEAENVLLIFLTTFIKNGGFSAGRALTLFLGMCLSISYLTDGPE